MSLKVWKYVLIILILLGIIFLLHKFTIGKNWKTNVVSPPYDDRKWNWSSNLSESLPTFHHYRTFCPHLGKPSSPEEELEERSLLNSITWPQLPSGLALNFLQTSDPAHSLFTIVTSKIKPSWYVGDQLEVRVQLRDFKGRPKRYGGDLLLAKLHSPKYRAGVAGQVLDHKNGLYSVLFPLLWEGSAKVNIMMVHSSEAIAVLWRLRENRPDRVYFSSFFRRGNHSEKMMCNMCLPPDKGPLCNYTDLHTGEPWFCYKPTMLSCETRINHLTGAYTQGLITKKEALLFQSGKNVKVTIQASKTDTINVLPPKKENVSQKPDPVKLATSGYYYQGLWRPLGAFSMHQFHNASAITQCLTNKLVYMYDLKRVNLENQKTSGPSMAVDSTHNILVQYRFHGTPVRTPPVLISDLHYIANELDGVTGGHNTVVTIGIWAHFSTFPVEVYINRLRHIRKAVVRLLDRAPKTLVVVRTANPQALEQKISLYKSDWLTLQQDIVLRTMFKGLNVFLVDAWQMCLAHHEPHNLHPPRVIVKTMVDMMLSYI